MTQSSKGTDKSSYFCLVHLTFAFLPKAVMHLALTAVQARLEARSHDSQKLGKGAPALPVWKGHQGRTLQRLELLKHTVQHTAAIC
jgi:hypothetical protein